MNSPAPVSDTLISLWINELFDCEMREVALSELAAMRLNQPNNMAPLVWFSFGAVSVFLEEITSAYVAYNERHLTPSKCQRLCNVMAILSCVASHPETLVHFLKSHIAMFVFPFLEMSRKGRLYSCLQTASFALISSVARSRCKEVVSFLLSSNFVPLCTKAMGQEEIIVKVLATYSIELILSNEIGLEHFCESYQKFETLAVPLGQLVLYLESNFSTDLCKHVLNCYLRLADHERAKLALQQCLPRQLYDSTFQRYFNDNFFLASSQTQILVKVFKSSSLRCPLTREPSSTSSSQVIGRRNKLATKPSSKFVNSTDEPVSDSHTKANQSTRREQI